ncbi:DUF5360 family protein [Nonomuraea sp. AD125B]|uniref:DUF5360 family protein n=1 Tax=Nonomuraea TaxID=83681 RepID=UPI0035277668
MHHVLVAASDDRVPHHDQHGGPSAVAFWALRGDFTLTWWLPNLFLLLFPLPALVVLTRTTTSAAADRQQRRRRERSEGWHARVAAA